MDPGSLLPLVLLVVLFYFMLIRPQQRRLKQHQALVSSLTIGDEVLTIGGVYGIVRSLRGDQVTLEVAENTLVRFSRQAINKKIDQEEPGSEAEPAESPEVETP